MSSLKQGRYNIIKHKFKLAALSYAVLSTLALSNVAIARDNSASATGNSAHKIDASKNTQYSNSYKKNDNLPKITTYLSNWTHFEQGYVPNLDELAKNDTVLLSFFGLCGTQIGDTSVVGGVGGLKKSCDQFGLKDYELASTDIWADLHKPFIALGEKNWRPDPAWLEANPKGMLGVMKKLHEEKGTRVGISIFGWSLSNIASDAVKAENRPVFIKSLIDFVKAYPFIGQLDIDWEYPGIQGASQNVFDPINDARNYKEFIAELRQALDTIGRQDMLIGIASGAPTDKIDAAELGALVDAGVDNIHLMTYDFFGQWDSKLNHHTNLYSADESKWSADKAIQYMINDLAIPAKNIQLGYANYSRNAIASGPVQPSPLKGDFTPQNDTAGSYEAASSNINDIVANYLNVQQNQKLTGKNGYTLYTDKVANADFLYNDNNKLFISLDTPRTVFAKSQYALKYGLGGVFNWMGDPDEGLMLNAAREGLGYEVDTQVFNMSKVISSCGANVVSVEECSALTFDAEQAPNLVLSDQNAVFVVNGSYDLGATLSGVDASLVSSIEWLLLNADGVNNQSVVIGNSSALNTVFAVNVSEEPGDNVVLTFKLNVKLKDGSSLSNSLTYTLKVNETVPEISAITHDNQYYIKNAGEFKFTVNATDKADDQLAYQWNIESNNVTFVSGTNAQRELFIDTSSLLNKPHYDVVTKVIVTNKFGHSDSAFATTTVIGDADANAAPVASIEVMSDTLEQNATIEVKSVSEDEIIDQLSSEWSVTFEGQPIVIDASKGVIASFVATEAGDYQVTLTVTDVFDVHSTQSTTITIAEKDTNQCTNGDTPEYPNWPRADWVGGEPNHATTGDLMIYEGTIYEAKWYTTLVPGSDGSWKVSSDCGIDTDAGDDSTDTGDDSTDTGDDSTNTGDDSTNAGDDSTNTGDDSTNAGDDSTDAGWSASNTYNTGDQVIYNGITYTAKWWTKGDLPSESDVWDYDSSDEGWSANKVYNTGDQAIYNGVTYVAKWWVKGETPDQSNTWTIVK